MKLRYVVLDGTHSVELAENVKTSTFGVGLDPLTDQVIRMMFVLQFGDGEYHLILSREEMFGMIEGLNKHLAMEERANVKRGGERVDH